MKKFIPLLCGLCILCGSIAFAAWTKQTARIPRMHIETAFDSAGAATAVVCEAQLVAIVTNDADATQVKGAAESVTVRFGLLTSPVSNTNYTAAGKTVNGVQLAALLRQVALDEATRQAIAP